MARLDPGHPVNKLKPRIVLDGRRFLRTLLRGNDAQGVKSSEAAMDLLSSIGQALLMAFGMFWKTGWSLVLGFSISAVLQAVVSKDRMRSALGRAGPKQIALATVAWRGELKLLLRLRRDQPHAVQEGRGA